MVKNDKVEVIVSEVVDFIAYVESFYGNVPNAIYPIGASPKMIIAATSKYINSLNEKVTWGGGLVRWVRKLQKSLDTVVALMVVKIY